jgi:hypothetical protein
MNNLCWLSGRGYSFFGLMRLLMRVFDVNSPHHVQLGIHFWKYTV